MASFDDVQIQGGGLTVDNASGETVGELRSNPSEALEDYPSEARFFGELSLSRPDHDKPSVRASALDGSVNLGVRNKLDGLLRLYSDSSMTYATIRMLGSALLLNVSEVKVSQIFECLYLKSRSVSLSDPAGTIRALWDGVAGKGQVSDAAGTLRYEVDSATGRARAFDASGTLRHDFNSATANMSFFDANGNGTLTLDGQVGDIVLQNADCAEEFSVDPAAELPTPGSVVVLGPGGHVRASDAPADTRVAGVVSGAGRYRPGLLLDRQPDDSGRRVPVALMGKVCCLVDATEHPVRAGDLLTSATACGHAARLVDPEAARGAVLGKALGDLPSGRGMVPVLVTLQ